MRSVLFCVLAAAAAACRSDPGGKDGGDCDVEGACELACPDAGAPAVSGWDDRVGPWLRRMQVQSTGATAASPVPWSMINQACQNRSLLLQLGLLLAKDPTKPPLVVKEAELTDGFLNAALAAPALEVGSLQVTGPLMVDQRLGPPVCGEHPMKPWLWYWPYHAVPVVKVNGSWMVFDLSVGDRPVAIDDWLKNVVAAPVTCQPVDQAGYQQVWDYWLVVLGTAFDPPAQRPTPLCAYLITPALTLREGAASSAQFPTVRAAPSAMETQVGALQTMMAEAKLPELSAEQLAQLVSIYAPVPEKTFCSRPYVDLRYCPTVK